MALELLAAAQWLGEAPIWPVGKPNSAPTQIKLAKREVPTPSAPPPPKSGNAAAVAVTPGYLQALPATMKASKQSGVAHAIRHFGAVEKKRSR